MRTVIEKAPAKLNLFLEVTRRREDGYHDIVSVMQSVSLFDTLAVTLRADSRITVESGRRYIPCDARNTALAAASLFCRTYGISAGCDIAVTKGIPVTAGMGGGSADAGAVLRALCRLHGLRLTVAQLRELALQIGSDVPFCVTGGTALAGGRGEQLQPLAVPELYVVLCKNARKLSTADAYSRLDAMERSLRSEQGMLDALAGGCDAEAVGKQLYNAFTPLYRETAEEIMGACAPFEPAGMGMSGAGPTCFALFARRGRAAACCSALREAGFYARTCRTVGAKRW